MSLFHTWRTQWVAEAPALTHQGTTWTYADLDVRVRRAAGWLAEQGVARGDVVALMMPRGPAFLELVLGCLARGAAALPLNDRYPAPEVAYFIGDAAPALAVLPSGLGSQVAAGRRWVPAESVRQHLDDAPERALEPAVPADTPAMLMYTSGTTGRPKGALHDHASLGATIEALHQAFRWQSNDVILHVLPQYHVHGLVVAQLGALRAGAHARWLPKFDAEAVVRALDGTDVTVFMGVPTFYQRLLAHPQTPDVSGIRLFTSGSAPLPAPTFEAFHQRYGHRVLERYGMTEIGIVLANPYDDRRSGAVGKPMQQVEVRIVDPGTVVEKAAGDVGEVQIRGPSVFRGYLGRPEATADAVVDGWMRTGDLGHRDAEGYIRLVGRRSDLVLTGGFNVYPAEVEGALLEHPAVTACAVFGLPDADLGERVAVAWVGAETSSTDPDLRGFLRERLAAYKVPRDVHRVEALPRNAMGKVLKRELRERFGPNGP
ncbi:MAG: acyl-CoA synthetase [Myxococcota bacterium]